MSEGGFESESPEGSESDRLSRGASVAHCIAVRAAIGAPSSIDEKMIAQQWETGEVVTEAATEVVSGEASGAAAIVAAVAIVAAAAAAIVAAAAAAAAVPATKRSGFRAPRSAAWSRPARSRLWSVCACTCDAQQLCNL